MIVDRQTPSNFKLIERIGNLLRSEERKQYAAMGLQPIHGQVLAYLARCNHYSNTHSAVAEYLGLTKGTVSQTIQILEKKQYLTKTLSDKDARVVHLTLTESGRRLVAELKPLEMFERAEAEVSERSFDSLASALQTMLKALQQVNQTKTFGNCPSCYYFSVEAQHYFCGLTEEALNRDDTDKICRDHIPQTDSSLDGD